MVAAKRRRPNWTARARDILAAHRAGKAPSTLVAYDGDLERYRRHARARTVAGAVAKLVRHGRGPARASALTYQAALIDLGLAPATVNRRIATVQSVTRTACQIDAIPWRLEIPPLPVTRLRDTAGPGPIVVARMIEIARDAGGAAAARDVAIVYLFYAVALRLGEAHGMNVGDVEADRRAIRVKGKGRRDYQRIAISRNMADRLADWIANPRCMAGPDEPLFVPLDRSHPSDRRISRRSMARIVERHSTAAGRRTTPHGLRHSGITDAINRGDPSPRVQRYSRHADGRTIEVYYDNAEAAEAEIIGAHIAGIEALCHASRN